LSTESLADSPLGKDASCLTAFFRQNGFLPVTSECFSLFKSYDDPKSLIMETTATITLIWGGAINAVYKIISGFLCVTAVIENAPLHFEIHRPLETPPDSTLQQLVSILFNLTQKAGLPALVIGSIEEQFLKEYEEVSGYSIETHFDDDHSEYIYKPKDLLELSGGVNLNKRTRLKKFLNDPHITFKPLTPENSTICFLVQQDWCKNRDCDACRSFAGCEVDALKIMLAIFDNTIYNGVLCYRDDKPVGYAIWENKAKKVAYIYFALANETNLNVYMYYMMVKMYLFEVEYINVNEDMGNAGLRTFKSHLGIYEQQRKYTCTYLQRSKAK
jgi:hypothetical protein